MAPCSGLVQEDALTLSNGQRHCKASHDVLYKSQVSGILAQRARMLLVVGKSCIVVALDREHMRLLVLWTALAIDTH